MKKIIIAAAIAVCMTATMVGGCGATNDTHAEDGTSSQMERYRQALDQYARTRKGKFLGQIRDIERELLTPYYAALSLHTVDIRAVCNELRQKAGMPKLEEMQ